MHEHTQRDVRMLYTRTHFLSCTHIHCTVIFAHFIFEFDVGIKERVKCKFNTIRDIFSGRNITLIVKKEQILNWSSLVD